MREVLTTRLVARMPVGACSLAADDGHAVPEGEHADEEVGVGDDSLVKVGDALNRLVRASVVGVLGVVGSHLRGRRSIWIRLIK